MTPNRSLPARLRRPAVLFAAALLTAGVSGVTSPASAAPPEKTAVIVQLTPGSDAAAESRRAAGNGGGSVAHVYTEVFRGFAGEFTPQAIAALERSPRVALIEADDVVTVTETASWGLDRIDQRELPLDQTYTATVTATGPAVTAYVIDTGVAAHGDLDQREGGVDTVDGGADGSGDCNGHGTHVAGTIAGTTYGVAKDAVVVPVRVLDCDGSGTWSGVIAGLDWVAGHHQPGDPAVANLSLGGSRNSSVDAAVQRVISDGVTVAVAAGNDGRDACNSSPARVAAAVTTGATDANDRRAYFSNYGSCVDLFAPGVDITSSWLGGGRDTISGTSMAAPHAAGAAALLAQNGGLAPAGVAGELTRVATTGVVGSAGSKSPNRLLFAAPLGAAPDTVTGGDDTPVKAPGGKGSARGLGNK